MIGQPENSPTTDRRTPLRSRSDAEAREKTAFLSDGRNLIGRPCAVRVVETHFAWVFLAGRRAFKLKKATRQASMDYRSLASREAGCREELRLNRRLAPGIYVRVVPLRRTRTGALALGRPGRTVDWLVEMRRLPGVRMLDRALRLRRVSARDIDRLVYQLVRFFREAPRRASAGPAYLERLRRQAMGNARELRAPDLSVDQRLVKQVLEVQLRFLEADACDLAGRGAHLVDGHGDLRPEHVYLGSASSRACVIDCIEFDPDLRRLDPAEEVAFLALECARLGRRRLARSLLERYRCRLPDRVSDALFQFYLSRRAAVRAQIMAWHLRDREFAAERPSWTARAHSYLGDALRHGRDALELLPREAGRTRSSNARSTGAPRADRAGGRSLRSDPG